MNPSPYTEDTLVQQTTAAYSDNYSDYRDTIPHIFHHNAIVMFGNGEKAKLGVFWHTQGAGKSYAMVLFTLQTSPCLKLPTEKPSSRG